MKRVLDLVFCYCKTLFVSYEGNVILYATYEIAWIVIEYEIFLPISLECDEDRSFIFLIHFFILLLDMLNHFLTYFLFPGNNSPILLIFSRPILLCLSKSVLIPSFQQPANKNLLILIIYFQNLL